MTPVTLTLSRGLLLLFLALVLSACATGPRYDTSQVDLDLTPQRVAADAAAHRDRPVVWGGIIVASENLEDRTRLEVLAYPLDRSQRPRTGQSPQGRFLVEYPGYLETADYAAGRNLTVQGRVDEVVDGRIGEAAYRYPRIAPDDLHLWPRAAEAERTAPRVRFGVGIILTN